MLAKQRRHKLFPTSGRGTRRLSFGVNAELLECLARRGCVILGLYFSEQARLVLYLFALSGLAMVINKVAK
jgi:hypothetical protein